MAFITLQNHRIEYQWYLPSVTVHENPIVMLHEGLGSVSLWKEFPQQLADASGHAILAYSRYGYGESDPLTEKREPAYLHDEALLVLPELREKFAIKHPILFGHSDGASIAIIHAGAQRWPVSALIILSPLVYVEEVGIKSITQAREAYLNSDLKERLAKRHADPHSAFWGWCDIWLDPRFLAWNIEEYLPHIECPVLAIQGYQDQYGTMEQIHRTVRGVEKVDACKLDDCGHSPHRDQPDAVIAAVTTFLNSMKGS